MECNCQTSETRFSSFEWKGNGLNTVTWNEMPHHLLRIEWEDLKNMFERIRVWEPYSIADKDFWRFKKNHSFYIFTTTDHNCELETGVDFFRLSNVTGIFKGFREDSGVFGLPELLAFGSEVLQVGSAWPEGTCVCPKDEAVSWLCSTSLYLLVIKLTWLLISWPARPRSTSAIKSKITWASAVKKKEKDN